MAFIKAEKLKHKFVRRDEQGEIEDVTLALDDVNIEVEEGEHSGYPQVSRYDLSKSG